MDKNIFKQDSKSMVDMLFNTKAFREDITRDDMNTLESFIDSIMQNRFESYVKLEKLMERINKK